MGQGQGKDRGVPPRPGHSSPALFLRPSHMHRALNPSWARKFYIYIVLARMFLYVSQTYAEHNGMDAGEEGRHLFHDPVFRPHNGWDGFCEIAFREEPDYLEH